MFDNTLKSVSYTHLDVYKRQSLYCVTSMNEVFVDSDEGNNFVANETDVVTIEGKYGGDKHSFIVDTAAEI